MRLGRIKKGQVIFMAGRRQHLTPLGKEIKKKLIDKNMTSAMLAAELGVKPPYISMIMTGDRRGAKYILKICTILDINYRKHERTA